VCVAQPQNFEVAFKHWSLTLATTISKNVPSHMTFHPHIKILSLCSNMLCLTLNAKWSMPIFKYVIHCIKIISCLPSKRDWKCTNELDLKATKGSKIFHIILPRPFWLFAPHKWQRSRACANLIKFFIVLERRIIQSRFKKVLISTKCSKLDLQ